MNEKTTYEITIARKLEELPVPDLSELIWSRIEKELDSDPGDTPGDNNPAPSSPLGGIIMGGLGVVLVIAFLINFFTTKKENTFSPTDTIETQQPATIQEPGAQELENPVPFNGPPQNTPVVPVDKIPVQDTPAIVPTITDPTALDPGPIVVDIEKSPAPAAVDSAGKKKARGVTGISPDDYKIVPKKDSL